MDRAASCWPEPDASGRVLSDGFRYLATDAAGGRGPVSARLLLFPDIPASLAADVGVPEGTDLHVIDEDYSGWGKYRNLRVQQMGQLVEPGAEGQRWRVFVYPDGSEVFFRVLLQRAKYLGSVGYGQARWRDGRLSDFSICDFDPSRHRLNDLKSAWDAVRALANIKQGPGPQPKGRDQELKELEEAADKILALESAPDRESLVREITHSALADRLLIGTDAVAKKLQRTSVKNLRGLRAHLLTKHNL